MMLANDRNEDHLPEPDVEPWFSGEEATPERVKGMLCNPLYTGIGPCPAAVTDEQWVKSATRQIVDQGPEQFLVNVLYLLRAYIGRPDDE